MKKLALLFLIVFSLTGCKLGNLGDSSVKDFFKYNYAKNWMYLTTGINNLLLGQTTTTTNTAILQITGGIYGDSATTTGDIYANAFHGDGSLLTGLSSGTVGAWELHPTIPNTLRPTSTTAGIFVSASSTIDNDLRVSGKLSVATTTPWRGDVWDYGLAIATSTIITSTTTIGANNTLVVNPQEGRVGIGTASPASALEVVGEYVRFKSTGGEKRFEFYPSTDSNQAQMLMYDGSESTRIHLDTHYGSSFDSFTGNGLLVGSGADPSATFQVSGSAYTPLYVSATSGKVAIFQQGFTDLYGLTVATTTYFANNATFAGGSSFNSITTTDTAYIGGKLTAVGGLYSTASTTIAGNATTTGSFMAGDTLFVQKDTGRVGIGTASPAQKLEVNGSIKLSTGVTNQIILPTRGQRIAIGTYGTLSETISGASYIQGNNVAASQTTIDKITKSGSASDGAQYIGMRYDRGIWFGTGIGAGDALNTEYADNVNQRMVINTTGLVGIGQTTPTAMLHASTTNESTVGMRITLSGTAPTADALNVQTQAGVNLFSIASDGDIYSTGGMVLNVASTTAIDIQNGSGTSVFKVDTTNNQSVMTGLTVASATTTDTLAVGNYIQYTLAGDNFLYFDNAKTEYLSWDDNPGEFDVSDDLNITGNATTSASMDAAYFCISGANCISAWPSGTSKWDDNGTWLDPTNGEGIVVNASSTITDLYSDQINATTTNTDTLKVFQGLTAHSATTTDSLSVGGIASSTSFRINDDFVVNSTGSVTTTDTMYVSSYRVRGDDFKSFYISSSTEDVSYKQYRTASTSFELALPPYPITILDINCKTDVSVSGTECGDGTNMMTYIACDNSADGVTVTMSSNNIFNALEPIVCELDERDGTSNKTTVTIHFKYN